MADKLLEVLAVCLKTSTLEGLGAIVNGTGMFHSKLEKKWVKLRHACCHALHKQWHHSFSLVGSYRRGQTMGTKPHLAIA